MVQDAIEALLRQKLGLDANSVGSRLIERAVEQRQIACQITNRATYLAHLRSSPDEMNQLVEAVVVPETWFFRDREPFEYLRQYVKQPVKQPVTTEYQRAPGEIFRVLSLPCSTGEEPYSIAITLLEAGLKPAQFQVDAIDVSQQALLQAQRGVYRKKSFRGGAIQHLEQYFQPQTGQPPTEGYTVRSVVQESVEFRQGNVLNANLLLGRQYHAIFCRNLLIYLDEAARHQVMTSLDRALLPLGLLFLGSAETTQINPKTYQSIEDKMERTGDRGMRTVHTNDLNRDSGIHSDIRSGRLSSGKLLWFDRSGIGFQISRTPTCCWGRSIRDSTRPTRQNAVFKRQFI